MKYNCMLVQKTGLVAWWLGAIVIIKWFEIILRPRCLPLQLKHQNLHPILSRSHVRICFFLYIYIFYFFMEEKGLDWFRVKGSSSLERGPTAETMMFDVHNSFSIDLQSLHSFLKFRLLDTFLFLSQVNRPVLRSSKLSLVIMCSRIIDIFRKWRMLRTFAIIEVKNVWEQF